MSRNVACPNCGGEHTLANPGITMLVCSFCKSVVYWGDDAQIHAGNKSVLPESDSRLYLMATGKLKGVGFQVLGHLRYDHGRGSWDEWYLQLDDDRVVWISEDERELSLETPLTPDAAPPPSGQLEVGSSVPLGGVAFTVRELGRATCTGGEGQLPFTVLPGEQYPYADLASVDGQRFATLEYDEGDSPTCFVGEVLDHDTLQVDDERPPSTQAATAGRHIKCTNCSAAIEVPGGREVETKVCEYCGAQLDLASDEQSVLGVNPQNYDPQFQFEVGDAAKFYGKRHEVCGRLLYQDDEGYSSREYLLFNPDAGYLWLVEEQNHFVINRPTQQAPARDPFSLSTGKPVRIGSDSFRFYEQGSSHLVYVDGALPWQAKVGDRFRYADLVAPPQLFGVETDGNEVEYFHGRYTAAEEVWKAFERQDRPSRGLGVHPAQPFVRSAVAKSLMVMGGLFALVNLGLALWSLGGSGTRVFEQSFAPTAYLTETVSKPFQLPACSVVALHMASPLDNSWMAVDVAFLNEKQEVVAEMDNSIEYYHGYEGGESWSEGTRDKTAYFRAPPAGQYRLILKASAGSGTGASGRGENLRLSVDSGVVLTRYFLIAFIIAVLFPLFEILRKGLFEKRRWAPVMEDDDDDDDDWD